MSDDTRRVELRPITMEDLPLYEALLTDPRMMTELGGPLAREGLADKLRGIVHDVEAGTVWFDVIVEDGVDVGTVCVWDPEEADASTEIGWMVLPEHQGRGLASTAVQDVLRRARSEPRWTHIDAHPGVTNAASNAICRKAGFIRLGEHDVDYVGRTLRCAHWRVDVS
jgi:RimJ/RimL family protein N-acetyltransferase